jgi:hypothetical protein
MPIYTYKCQKCGAREEHVVSYDLRDSQFHCSTTGCRGYFARDKGLERPTIGKPGYQMQAVLSDGSHVKGHFGKDAKRNRR